MRRTLALLALLWLALPLAAQEGAAPPPEKLVCFIGDDAFDRHLEQGALHRGRQKLFEAYDHYNCAVQLAPMNWMAYRGRGIALAGQGRYQEALADYRRGLQLNNTDPVLYYQQAFALHRLGQFEAALAAVAEALQLNPQYALAYNLRGLIHRDLEAFSAAERDFIIAADLGLPDQPYVPYMNLGNLYKDRLGNPGMAAQWYEEALRAAPGSAFIYEILGDTYLALERPADAEYNYRRYVETVNTAREDVIALVQAARLRQFVAQYLPVTLLVLVAGGYVGAGLWRSQRQRRAGRLARLAPVAAPVLTPQTPLPGPDPVPPVSHQAPAPAPARPGWLALLLLPLVAGLVVLLRQWGPVPPDIPPADGP
ncbi:MAG: tetratricopeptide repeat protein [Anaerolineae bacterium]|jgi:tetratricopeptide (TPR) repeat protein|nr:tetratricopeptide repeat protein [Anaerolineae bacterium]